MRLGSAGHNTATHLAGKRDFAPLSVVGSAAAPRETPDVGYKYAVPGA